MIFITGPLFSGKQTYAATLPGTRISDVQDLAAQKTPDEIPALADELAAAYDIVIATEVGGGIVPMQASDRAARENAGRLSCALAERADTVVRLCCGIPEVLKGEAPV